MKPHSSFRLNNGLRFVVLPMDHVHSTHVSVVIGAGAGHESLRDWGLSHFVEHMLFRGNRALKDATALALAFEKAGGTLCAETWRDHMHLSVMAEPRRISAALTALAYTLHSPSFVGRATEKALVQEEILAELDEHGQEADLCNASRACVWPHQAMGRRITGSHHQLEQFDRARLKKHHARLFGARNMVVGIAGNMDGRDVQNIATKAFRQLASGKRAASLKRLRFAPSEPVHIIAQPQSRIAVQLTFEAIADTHSDFAALSLLSMILDDGMAAPLYRALSIQSGLVYDLESGLDCYANGGVYDVAFHTAPEHAHLAAQRAIKVLAHIASFGVTRHMMQDAKNKTQFLAQVQYDSPEEAAYEAALNLYFRRSPHATRLTKVLATRLEQINRVARQLLRPENMHATIIGPCSEHGVRCLKNALQWPTRRRSLAA